MSVATAIEQQAAVHAVVVEQLIEQQQPVEQPIEQFVEELAVEFAEPRQSEPKLESEFEPGQPELESEFESGQPRRSEFAEQPEHVVIGLDRQHRVDLRQSGFAGFAKLVAEWFEQLAGR